MAQERTTNLDLVLPIQADDVLVQDINGNMTKIDTFAGQTNQALSTYVDNGHCKVVANSTDINTITTPGHYYIPGNASNSPFEGYMDVYSYNSEFVKQIVYTARSNNPQIVFRTKQGGVWDSWKDLALKSNIKFGAWTSITLPYTTQQDGFIYVYLNPSSTAGGRTRISVSQGDIINQITAVALDGNGVSSSLPVRAGSALAQQELSNANITVRFMPFGN